jgi:hypothetical protein
LALVEDLERIRLLRARKWSARRITLELKQTGVAISVSAGNPVAATDRAGPSGPPIRSTGRDDFMSPAVPGRSRPGWVTGLDVYRVVGQRYAIVSGCTGNHTIGPLRRPIVSQHNVARDRPQ